MQQDRTFQQSSRFPGAALLLLALAVLVSASACSSHPAPSRPIVLCSVLPQAWFIQRLAGEAVQVEVMIPPGASPATYEPSVQQMQAASRASLYVKVGHPSFPFEKTWLDSILQQGRGMRQVDASEGLEYLEGDPHVWVSPGCARVMARNLATALAELLPQKRQEIQANLAHLNLEIDALDAELRLVTKDRHGERFYVFHPAWSYLAREYGLQQVAVEQEGREPSAGQLAGLIQQARGDRVRVVFVQPQFSQQSARMLARDLNARVVPLDPLGPDWPSMLRQFTAAFRDSR